MTKPKAPNQLRKQLLLYLPVIHQGYHQLLQAHADATEVLVLGDEFGQQFDWMRKDVRALSAQAAIDYVNAGRNVPWAKVVQPANIDSMVMAQHLVMPNEDVMHKLADHFGWAKRCRITYIPTFLRWDKATSGGGGAVIADKVVTATALTVPWLSQATSQANRSSDWWRQVGAVAVSHGSALVADHNRHLPSAYTPYIDGDPRANFSKGLHIELTTAIHAEAAIIARAAHTGVVLSGADLYVTTFPCPNCARLIAEAGFARCYFIDDYAMLDGEAILRQAGVTLIRVDIKSPRTSPK